MTINTDVKAELKHFLRNDPMYSGLLPSNFDDDYKLVTSGALDSIGIFNLVAFLEKTFHISIEAADLVEPNFASVNAIEVFIKARKK